ncbi:MAG: hypothetical protein OEQ53_11705, partial [Saprospiraceae bacterium]|nr:hypothetical protein [Saprospiraceae bacterium]
GSDLPIEEDSNDPIFRKYQAFKSYTATDWIEKVHKAVKAINPHTAICTYMDDYVDIIRHESLTGSLPYWPYQSSDNVSSTMHSHPNKIVSNASIQQISFQSRYNAIEPEETAIRLYENIANGSGLDMSLMGDFRNYQDERNFAMWEALYAHHKKYEPYFGHYQSPAEICIVSPGYWPGGSTAQEYRGIQAMLKETHLQFDIIESEELKKLEKKLSRYRLFILPQIVDLDTETIELLTELCIQGKAIIATNLTMADNESALHQLFGASRMENLDDGAGYYLSPENKRLFQSFQNQSLLFWKFQLGFYDFSEADETYLPIYTPGQPGPPEKIGGHEPTGYHAIGMKAHQKGLAVLMPLNLGRLYYIHGFEQHKNILLDVIHATLPDASDLVQTDAHERVEVVLQNYIENTPENFHQVHPDGMILHLINLTGFSRNTYFNPLPIHNMHFRIRTGFKPAAIQAMVKNKNVSFLYDGGYTTFTLDHFGQFEGLVIER